MTFSSWIYFQIYDERSEVERGEYSKKYDQYQYQYNNQAQYTLMQQPKVIQYIFEQFNNIFLIFIWILQVAEPTYMFGTIRDWVEKHNDKLSTAASNLHFYVQEYHKHTGKIYKLDQLIKNIFKLKLTFDIL